MSDVPMPKGWNKRAPTVWVVLALTGAGGMYCTTKTVLAVMQTHWIAAAIAACAAAVLLIAAVGMAFALFGRNRLRASFDATGTTLRVGRTMFWWLEVPQFEWTPEIAGRSPAGRMSTCRGRVGRSHRSSRWRLLVG